jgi:hypothetical protein
MFVTEMRCVLSEIGTDLKINIYTIFMLYKDLTDVKADDRN